jgi:hypothetical protein
VEGIQDLEVILGNQDGTPTDGIRPPAGKVVPGGTAALVLKGGHDGVSLQIRSIYGGHRSDGAGGSDNCGKEQNQIVRDMLQSATHVPLGD